MSGPIPARMMNTTKPRLVFFRFCSPNLPTFVNGHLRDHVDCLRGFFDVFMVSEPADYDEVVDRVQPDLALFESGVYARPGRRITNTDRHPQVPKLGLLNADAYCLTRSVFLSDMDDWGVDTFFSIAISASAYMPTVADRMFTWPNFADRRVFHSYDGPKTQTILLSGSRASNYPWRVRIDRLLRERFPFRRVQHAGWFDSSAAASMPTGQEYARSLSSALIVPTCGTIAEDLVRKHLEIPAAGALLLTQRTATVEAAGFVDMVNCVFADDRDVVDKVQFLLDNPDLLQGIARAGQELAHSRHSIEHRGQIRQWYELNRRKRLGERIMQPDPFGQMQLELLNADSRDNSVAVRSVGLLIPSGIDRRLIAEGDDLLAAGSPAAAAERFAEVLNLHYEPEAALGLARSWVRLGRAVLARQLLEYSTGVVRRPHGASHPDPVEWAWVIRVAMCEGDLRRAHEASREHVMIVHPELHRIRDALSALIGKPVPPASGDPNRSIHAGIGLEDWEDWRIALAQDLHACSQPELAASVRVMPRVQAESTLEEGAIFQISNWTRAIATRARGLEPRARRRLRREWAAFRGHDTPSERASLFQVLEGIDLDVVVTILVDDQTSEQIQELVARDPFQVSLVRLGCTVPPIYDTFAPRGLRSGVVEGMLAELPNWGRAMVVASGMGAGLLRLGHVANARVLAILSDGSPVTALEAAIEVDPGWRPFPDDRSEPLAGILGQDRAHFWEQDSSAVSISASATLA